MFLKIHKTFKSGTIVDPFKPSVLIMGHLQTMQNQIRQHLIRFSTVCLQNVLIKFE